MAERIRAHDWSDSPLKARERWPSALRCVVEMMLASPQVASVVVGAERVLLYNDAAAALYGARHPGALGRPLPACWPETWVDVEPFYERAFAGEGIHVPEQPLDVERPGAGQVFEAYLTPIRDVDGAVIGVHMTGSEVGARLRAEAALRRSAERQALLLALSDAIRSVSDPAEIQRTAMRLMGEHLGLSRAYFFDVFCESGSWLHVIDDAWQREPGGPSMIGRHALKDFGESLFEGFARGEVISVADVSALPTVTPEELASYDALRVTAFINVPLLRDGEYSAGIGAQDTRPHAWTRDTIDIIREFAARTWTAVERARAEAALRESEETLAADLANAELLRGIAERLVTEENAGTIYGEILSAAVIIAGADAGTVQIYDPATRSLDLLAVQNFSHPIVERFRNVDASSRTACGIALRTGQRAFVDFADEDDDEGCLLLVGAGFRSALAIPLVSRAGVQLGKLNTHWHAAGHRPTERQLRFLELLARQAADLIERRKAQQVLRESSDRLSLVFRTLPIGIAIIDAAGEIVMSNGEMRRFLPTGRLPSRGSERVSRWRGWDADGRTVRPEDFPGARALRGEAVFPGMQMLFHDGGPEIWTEVLASPLQDGDGQISGAITVVVDVDRVKRSEEAARASEERLRQFGEASQDVLWIRDADTLQWTYLTSAFEAIYGVSCEEALTGDNYRGWQDLILAEDRDHAVANIKRVRAGEHVTFEYRIRRPTDRRVRWLRNTDFPMRDGAGQVSHIGGIGHDVTDLKAIEAALIHSERRLRTLIEGVPQLVWRADDDGDWTWASPQWTAYTGQPEPDSHHRGWLNPVHPDDRERAKAAWEHARKTGGFEVEYRIGRLGGDAYRWFQTRATPVRNEAGEIMEWLGTSTDIEDLKVLQEHQSVLVAELQHRTRNLIAVVRGIANDTMRKTGANSAFRAVFGDRLSALSRVQDLLSRSEAEPITISSLVQLELDALGAGNLGDRVIVAGPEVFLRPSTVQTLALALHELATNARKHGALSHGQGCLAVTWHEQDEASEHRLFIEWLETGLERAPERRTWENVEGGYGRELIEQALPHALGARTSYALSASGVRCTIDLAVRQGKGRS